MKSVRPQTTVWHYTVGHRFQGIVSDGVIRLASTGVRPPERAAVWFTLADDWEETANKDWITPNGRVSLDRNGTERLCGGLVRIGIDESTAPHGWNQFVRLSKIDRRVAKSLFQLGRQAGSNPWLWRVSFAPVPRALWTAVCVWRGGQWVDVPLDPIRDEVEQPNPRRAAHAEPSNLKKVG